MPKKTSSLLAWSPTQQSYVLSQESGVTQCSIEPESSAWFAWLDQVSSFAFVGQRGSATLRKEIIHGESYWYAYRRTEEKLTKKYLGKTPVLTIARLEQLTGMLETRHACGKSLQRDVSIKRPDDEGYAPREILRPEPHSPRPLTHPGSHDPLFATKLQIPRPRAQLVPRPHLLERLQLAWTTPLTLVSAPAGFGKTTLLAQWVTGSHTPVAWLSLEPQDNDPVRFFTYLIAALQTIDPHGGTSSLELLCSPQPVAPETVVALLTNDLVHTTGGDFALVLDDYHVITAECIQL